MLISVCVPTIRATTLPFTIAAIRAQTWSNWELLIVAQGEDSTLSAVCATAASDDPRVRYIHLPERGVSLALNAGIDASLGEVIAFTGDDCEPEPRWLEKLHACFVAEPSVGIVAGDLVPSPRSKRRWPSTCPAIRTIECLYKPAEHGFHGPPGFHWGGANLAVRREVFGQVGGYDEYLGPGREFPAAEDVDLALRAEARGVIMWTRPSIVVNHTHGRRYGLRTVLRHHRGYALGSGALGAKLKLLDHRLSHEWGHRRSLGQTLRSLVKNPLRELLTIYTHHYHQIGQEHYLAAFELDDRALSRPKPACAQPSRGGPPA